MSPKKTFEIFKTNSAEQDIIQTGTIIAQDKPLAAFKWIDHIDETIQLIATNPFIGKKRSEVSSELYSLAVGNYTIFYRIVENKLIILRVLNRAKDINRDIF